MTEPRTITVWKLAHGDKFWNGTRSDIIPMFTDAGREFTSQREAMGEALEYLTWAKARLAAHPHLPGEVQLVAVQRQEQVIDTLPVGYSAATDTLSRFWGEDCFQHVKWLLTRDDWADWRHIVVLDERDGETEDEDLTAMAEQLNLRLVWNQPYLFVAREEDALAVKMALPVLAIVDMQTGAKTAVEDGARV